LNQAVFEPILLGSRVCPLLLSAEWTRKIFFVIVRQ
jgi:hypothetical protein